MVISGRSESGMSGWMAGGGAMPVSFNALSKFASMCRRDKRPVTGLSLRSLFAVRKELMNRTQPLLHCRFITLKVGVRVQLSKV